jgi:hypothetical protein
MDPQAVSWPNVIRDWRAVLVAVPVCVALVPISIVGFCQWRAVREAEAQGALKRDLIDRGLTVPEAERLVHGPPPAADVRRAEVDAALRTLRRSGLSPEEVRRAIAEPAAGNSTDPAPMPREP